MSLCVDTYSDWCWFITQKRWKFVFASVCWAAWECCSCGLRRRFLRTGVSAVSGLCSWPCHVCWEVVALGDTVGTSSIRTGFLWRFWFMDILGFAAMQPSTNPVYFKFLQKQNCQQVFGGKGIVQGLHQLFLSVLLTTWNTSGWEILLEASCPDTFQNVLSFIVRLHCPSPCKAEFWKCWGMEMMQLLREPVKAQERKGEAGMWNTRNRGRGVFWIKVLDRALHSVQYHSEHCICHISMKNAESWCHQTNFENVNESPLFCSD